MKEENEGTTLTVNSIKIPKGETLLVYDGKEIRRWVMAAECVKCREVVRNEENELGNVVCQACGSLQPKRPIWPRDEGSFVQRLVIGTTGSPPINNITWAGDKGERSGNV